MSDNQATTSLTNNGANMPYNLETPSVTKSRGYQSSHNTWVNTMRFNGASKHTRVWGRIQDTGVNYIVEGWKSDMGSNKTEWVQIPCANLATAQIHLISVMSKLDFEIERGRQVWDRMEREGKSYEEIMEKIGY
tara:strand:+ start:928 stop:1329 length:402 start_codon:yes stop_codon:yes gene_type:complete